MRRRDTATLLLVSLSAILTYQLLLAPTPTEGHSMTQTGSVTISLPIAAGTPENFYTVIDSQGPADKSWTIRTSIGLSNGDRFQKTRFAFSVQDLSNDNRIGKYGVPVRDWVVVGTQAFASTISTHSNGNFWLYIWIHMPEATNQTYSISGSPAYE
jgi:hypothetical protein